MLTTYSASHLRYVLSYADIAKAELILSTRSSISVHSVSLSLS